MKKSISTLLLTLMALFMCQQVSAQSASFYFEETELTYDLASSTPFQEPKLINPDGENVTYSVTPTTIAMVDWDTGKLTLFAEGIVTVTASSYIHDASYTVTVTDSRQEPGITFGVDEVVYDITSTEPFVAPELQNPNGLKVIYTTSDYSVATADAVTGAITIKGVGEVVIGASSDATDVYKAGKTQYTLKVTDPDVIAKYAFTSSTEGWVEEGSEYIWNLGYYGGLYCDGSYKYLNSMTDSYFVSPEVQFGEEGSILTFEHMAYGFSSWTEQARVVAREVGGEWIDCGDIAMPNAYSYEKTGKIRIPDALNGKKGQIAFKYVTDGYYYAGQWYIKNVLLKRYIKKLDPQISYDVAELEVDISKAFEAPVLNNPNNLEIVYSSSNTGVASVNSATGEVTLVGEGIAEITAKSVETKDYDEGSASYTIKVVDNSKLLVAPFFYDLCGFTEESSIGGIWSFYCNYAYAKGGGVATERTPCYLVSPEFKLLTKNNFSFDHMPDQLNGESSLEYCKFAVRLSDGENKGEWVEISLPEYVSDGWNGAVSTGLVAIPEEFNNKQVQVAIVYYATPNLNWTWWVRNLVVRGVAGDSKIEPGYAFSAETAEVFFNNNTGEFEGVCEFPQLINENNVPVTFKSDNSAVATVDEVTGEVTVLDYGVAVISAVNPEDDTYLAGEASYTLTVSIPTGIEGVTADDLKNGKVYNLQGMRVDKLQKGIYIVNGKKVVIK